MIEHARMTAILAAALVAATLTCLPPAQAAAPFDAAAIKTSVGPAVCRIVAANSWGVPTAYATGFLLGDGRFIIADIGVAAQAGAGQVTAEFADGTSLTCKEFGWADPGLGLVALRAGAGDPKRSGLPLAAAVPPLDGSVVVAAQGCRWAGAPELVTGRIWRGAPLKDMASRARIEPPAGPDAFIRMDGGRLELAGGSPVIDPSGTVLAVILDLSVGDVTLFQGMPAASVRAAMMAAQPQLKPLAELPRPLWPSRFVRIPGPPLTAAEITHTFQAVKNAFTCQMCKGTGKVEVDRGRGGFLGFFSRTHERECPDCGGGKIAYQDSLGLQLGALADEATRTVWAPVGVDERARVAARGAVSDVCKTIAAARFQFQRPYAMAVADEFAKPATRPPRGVFLYAQVQRHLDGPDGKYAILGAWRLPKEVAVRVNDLQGGPPGKAPAGPRRDPADGTWVVVGGTILSGYNTGNGEGLFMLPAEWCTAGVPGIAPPPAAPARP